MKKNSIEENTEKTADDVSENKENETEEKSSPITPDATFDSPNGKDVHRPVVYLELALAIIALVFIIVAILDWRKKNVTGPDASSNTATEASADTSALPSEGVLPEIDNSAVIDLKPAVPDASVMNPISEADCEKKVAEGTMLRLDCADGSYIYVNNYKDPEFLASSLQITDEEINQFIKEQILDVEPVNAPADHDIAQLGDTANIDYVGTLDGVAFEGGTASGYDLVLGSGSFIPGFEDGVVGMKTGETKDIPLTFPSDYFAAEMAGKEVIFTVTLNALTTQTYATELTDELAAFYSDGMYTTADAMKDYLKTNFMSVDKMQDFLTENLYVSEVSPLVIDEYYEMQVQQYMDYCEMYYGMSFADAALMQGYDLSMLLDDVMNEAAVQARLDVFYRAVLENDLAPITDDDVLSLASEYSEDPNAFIEEKGKDVLTLFLQRDKATAYLQELADQATLLSPDETKEESADTLSDNTVSDNASSTEPTTNAQ